jgi:hypothetical protein
MSTGRGENLGDCINGKGEHFGKHTGSGEWLEGRLQVETLSGTEG